MPSPPEIFRLLLVLILVTVGNATAEGELAEFREAPTFRNNRGCSGVAVPNIHIAMTLDATYLRGSLAGVHAVLQHASCPENIVFHFLATAPRRLHRTIIAAFPGLPFRIYRFNAPLIHGKISTSIHRALDQALNYARICLADLLPRAVRCIIYFDSDLIIVDDVSRLWAIDLGPHVLSAPEYCHANFTSYFPLLVRPLLPSHLLRPLPPTRPRDTSAWAAGRIRLWSELNGPRLIRSI